MKIFIEDYKGQVINYDDNNDKFCCDITVEDRYKSTNRKSLSDVRKEVDTFIKLNLDFKPFDAMEKTYNGVSAVRVESIRSDGKLVVTNGSSYKSYYDKKDIKNLYKYDKGLHDEFIAARKEFDDASDVYNAKKKSIEKRLVEPIDISKYEHVINQTA